MTEEGYTGDKVQSAIRANVRTRKGLSVNANREWEGNGCGAIVAMIACISVTRGDRARARAGGIVSAPCRCSCRRRRWRATSTARSVESEYIVRTACRSYADRQLRGPCRANPESATWILPGCGRI